ncbi:MAG: twin-arginine translocase subunit TatB [Chromatiales bacterium]|nr:twin-arginine translocase subunit TatB [Chromatiales bacterium]
MFDIGFWELLLIGVVALLVVGPERLPRLARTAGFWFGRAQRFISNVKNDIDREMRAEELKSILNKNSGGPQEFKEIIEETSSAFREAKQAGHIVNSTSPDPKPQPEAESPQTQAKKPEPAKSAGESDHGG